MTTKPFRMDGVTVVTPPLVAPKSFEGETTLLGD